MSFIDDLEEIIGPNRRRTIKKVDRKAKNRIRDGIEERECYNCKVWKGLDEFYPHRNQLGAENNGRFRMGVQAHCKACSTKLATKSYKLRKAKDANR